VKHFETKRCTKDGRIIDVSLSVSPICDAEGKIVGASKVARDITERKPMRDDIHANPVRCGLVARAEDWEWSSARWYAGLRPVKLEIDKGVIIELELG
jgi:hypothetical protein